MRRMGIAYSVLRIALFIFLASLHAGCVTANNIEEQSNLAKEEQQEKTDPNTWDFGEIKEGEVVKHVFILKNETGRILTIKGVNTSCGCTVSEAKKKELLPGENTEIEVKFNSKGYSGPIKQFVYVNTDDVDNPVIRFIITADVK